MKPSVHVAASVTGAVILWGVTGSWLAAASSCASGIFVDLDHFYDYALARIPWTSIRAFVKFWEDCPLERLILPLHAWENLILLVLLASLGIAPMLCLGLAFGLFHHLIIDQIGNHVRPRAYFLTARWQGHFLSTKFFTPQRSSQWPPKKNRP